MTIKTLAISAALLLAPTIATAGDITLKPIGESQSWGFMAMTRDPVTGTFITKNGYGFDGQDIQLHDGGRFVPGRTATSTTSLQGDTIAGTYIAANDGKLYGRTFTPTGQYDWPTGTSIARWDYRSGALEAVSAPMPGMGGENGYNSFNWGGFSGPNVMQDATGLYVLGTEDRNSWTIHQLNADLSIAATRSFDLSSLGGSFQPSLGYALLAGGSFYLAQDFYSTRLGARFDFATGTLSAVDIGLTGAGDGGSWPVYFSNSFYDSIADRMYLFDTQTSRTWKFDNAAQQLASGGTAGGVPEPASWAMLIAGFGLTGATIRRRRAILAMA